MFNRPIKFRFHRGALADSLETLVQFSNKDELYNYIIQWLYSLPGNKVITHDDIAVKYYCYDSRINWDTYLVTIKDWGPVGMTDGPVD